MPINIKNLNYNYSSSAGVSEAAVKNISLDIYDGETLCIIGHTGSGKSTLIQHINGLLQPTSGSICVNGVDLSDKTKRYEVRKNVGMVFQYAEYQLFEETIEKDIAFGPKNLGFADHEIENCVKRAMEYVHLDYEKYRSKSPFEISGGEKRRVAMAGVLATDPQVLILDEPMASLDPIGRNEMMSLIFELKKTKTIIMISHNMDDVALLADRVAVLKKGELVKVSSPQQIFSNPKMLFDIGLDVPQATNFALKIMQTLGYSQDEQVNIFKFEQLVNFICEKVSGE